MRLASCAKPDQQQQAQGKFIEEKWCPEADLNHRHADFQSAALPTELSGHLGFYAKPAGLSQDRRGRFPGSERGYNILFGHGKRLRALF